MRYILRINEVVDTLPEMEVETGHTSPNYAGLNRAEVLALIDLAIENNNFREAKELLAQLRGVQENGLFNYLQYTAINESIQDGKAIVQKLADEETSKLTTRLNREAIDPLPDEEKAARLAEIKERVTAKYFGPNSDFEKIKKLLHKNPMWVGAFTRFKFEQGATITGNPDKPGDLDSLHKNLVDLRDSIDDFLGLLDQYSKMQQEEGEVLPGFKQLGDYLTELFKLRRGKWIIDSLSGKAMSLNIPQYRALGFGPDNPINQRTLYRSTPKEKQLELLSAAAALNDLNEPALIKAVQQNMSGRASIDDIIVYINSQINAASNVDRLALIKKAQDSYPAAVVLYSGPNHMVISFRTDAELPFLADRAKTWCIQPKWYNTSGGGQFWGYASPNTGTLQLVLYDFTKEASDPYYLVGLTLGPSGKVNSLCTYPNSCSRSGEDFRTYLKHVSTSHGENSYPQDVIDGIDLVFQDESNTKKMLDNTYKKIFDYSKDIGDRDKALAETLIGLVRDMSDLTKKEDTDVKSKENIVNQVIASELKRLRNSSAIAKVQGDYIHKYTQGNFPIPSAADVKIFEIILEGSPRLTVDILNLIIQNNQNTLKTLDKNIKLIGQTVDNALSRKIKMLQPAVGEAMIALEVIKEKLKK